MSEKCNCMWCQRNVTAEEATAKRIDFIYKIFECCFLKLIVFSGRPIEKALEEFKIEITKFFQEQEQDVQLLIEPIYNISFYYHGLESELKPWEINLFANNIHNCVIKGFDFLKADIGIAETPVLSGLITPEMVVNYQLDEYEFPRELTELYMKQQMNSMSSMLSGLEEKFGFQVEIPERPGHTVH